MGAARAVAAAVLLAAGLTACSGGDADQVVPPEPTALAVVPDVVGLDQVEATASLLGAGLEWQWDPPEAAGTDAGRWVVVSQDPEAGARVAPLSTVVLSAREDASPPGPEPEPTLTATIQPTEPTEP